MIKRLMASILMIVMIFGVSGKLSLADDYTDNVDIQQFVKEAYQETDYSWTPYEIRSVFDKFTALKESDKEKFESIFKKIVQAKEKNRDKRELEITKRRVKGFLKEFLKKTAIVGVSLVTLILTGLGFYYGIPLLWNQNVNVPYLT